MPVLIALLALVLSASAHVHAAGIALDSGWSFLFTPQESTLAELDKNMPAGRWRPSSLPHTFGVDSATHEPLEGFGWYRISLTPPKTRPGEELRLCSEGAALRTTVFIDGKPVLEAPYAWLPFEVGLAEKNRQVRIDIRVDNRRVPGSIPDDKCLGWWIYGGLVRGIRLENRPVNRIDDPVIRTMFIGADTFDLDFSFTAHGQTPDSTELLISAGPATPDRAVFRGTRTRIRVHGVTSWTPQSPVLYVISATPFYGKTRGERLTLKRGFAQVFTRGDKLCLNGSSLFLRGIGRHDETGNAGPIITREQRRDELADIKSLGADFLRIAHFPQHRDIYELCDSIGLIVMDEIPAWKTAPRFLTSPEGLAFSTAYLREMVAAHGNHTCIGLWSVGNEFESYRVSVADYVRSAVSAVKSADSTRPVTFCSYYYVFDKCFSEVDVISVNEYFGWHIASLGLLSKMLDKIHADWPSKPVLVSEFGAQSGLGVHNPAPRLSGPIESLYRKDLSEDHHSLYVNAHIDTIFSRSSYTAGLVVWTYADFMCYSDKPRTPDMPPSLNACGLLTMDRRHKQVYETVRGRFSQLKTPEQRP